MLYGAKKCLSKQLHTANIAVNIFKLISNVVEEVTVYLLFIILTHSSAEVSIEDEFFEGAYLFFDVFTLGDYAPSSIIHKVHIPSHIGCYNWQSKIKRFHNAHREPFLERLMEEHIAYLHYLVDVLTISQE